MSSPFNYSQLLRPIGQVLESLGVESFILTVEGHDFSVRGKTKPEEKKSLRAIWHKLRGDKEATTSSAASSGMLELRYTPEDIARLEEEGRKRRKSSGADEAPEPHSLSQVLRACGAFVDQKEGRILAVKKEGQNVTIQYESALKQNISDEFTVAGLYDFYVRLYLKRSSRSG